jgi:hypothetical protein
MEEMELDKPQPSPESDLEILKLAQEILSTPERLNACMEKARENLDVMNKIAVFKDYVKISKKSSKNAIPKREYFTRRAIESDQTFNMGMGMDMSLVGGD